MTKIVAPQTKRDIPEPTKRQVRQECGFGCVICGAPIFEYDHIEDFIDTEDHNPKNIALLCSIHHRDKTSGRLDRSTVTAFRNAPYNKQKKMSAPHRFYSSAEHFCMMVGTNKVTFSADFLNDGRVFKYLAVNGEPLASIKFCELTPNTYLPLPSVKMLKKDGDLLLKITDGELVYALSNWDVELTGQDLKVRERIGKIIIHIILDPHAFRIMRGTFFHEYNEVIFDGDKISINGIEWLMSGGTFDDSNCILHVTSGHRRN